jgi:hypothetical protein
LGSGKDQSLATVWRAWAWRMRRRVGGMVKLEDVCGAENLVFGQRMEGTFRSVYLQNVRHCFYLVLSNCIGRASTWGSVPCRVMTQLKLDSRSQSSGGKMVKVCKTSRCVTSCFQLIVKRSDAVRYHAKSSMSRVSLVV